MPSRRIISFGICLCSVVVALQAAAQEPSALRLPEEWLVALRYRPVETELFDRAGAGRLDDGLLLEAALVAGGVADDVALRAHLERYRHWAERLRGQGVTVQRVGDSPGRADSPWAWRDVPNWAIEPSTLRLVPKTSPLAAGNETPAAAAQDPVVRSASAALGFMHQEILTGPYDVRGSRLENVFDGGAYNCVTATILFNCLARELGLTVCGGESPAHVVSVLRTPRGPLAIETTYARWFELSSDDAKCRSRATTGAAARGPVRRELGTAELTAIVYYNLGVDFAERRQYADAVAANCKALRLDPLCQNARGNLLAAVNNWALDLTERERFAQAVELLGHGRRVAPDHRTFARNHVAIHERWVQRLCHRGEFAEAAALLETAQRAFPDDPYFHSASQDVYRQWDGGPGD